MAREEEEQCFIVWMSDMEVPEVMRVLQQPLLAGGAEEDRGTQLKDPEGPGRLEW
jgi:hypothetical protein